MSVSLPVAGLGDVNALYKVYIANRPNFANFQNLTTVDPLAKGEIDAIGKACGNGWRKVFNVYAKLLFALNSEYPVPLQQAKTWQEFRDKTLLQVSSNTSLLFTPPPLHNKSSKGDVSHDIHIIMGKTYAKTLGLSLDWLDNDFAINTNTQTIVCPYFDYRQLSNIKIIRLVELITKCSAHLVTDHTINKNSVANAEHS